MKKERFFEVYCPRSTSADGKDILSFLIFYLRDKNPLKIHDSLLEAEKGYRYVDPSGDGTNAIIKQTVDNKFFGRSEERSDYHEWYNINITESDVKWVLEGFIGSFEQFDLLIEQGIPAHLKPKIDPSIEYRKKYFPNLL
jgi:hypothetical protein